MVPHSHSICLSFTNRLNRRLARYRRAADCIASAGAEVVTASLLIRAAKARALRAEAESEGGVDKGGAFGACHTCLREHSPCVDLGESYQSKGALLKGYGCFGRSRKTSWQLSCPSSQLRQVVRARNLHPPKVHGKGTHSPPYVRETARSASSPWYWY